MREAAVPTVSVVMPTFNRLKYLAPAIESVFAQTFQDWELMIADDGSEEETRAYLSSLEKDPRVRVLWLKHLGNPGAVRNAGWRATRGEYVAFLDSDDLWAPEKLELQIASLKSHLRRGWSHTAFGFVDAGGHPLTVKGWRQRFAVEGWILESLITLEAAILLPSLVVRRELLEQTGGFDIEQRMCEDHDLCLRLAQLSALDAIEVPLLSVRRHQEHSGNDAIAFADRGRALEKLLATQVEPALKSLLRRERARVAAGLIRSHAIYGGRRAMLAAMLSSSKYSWSYAEWWLGVLDAAARAATPAGMRRTLRYLAGQARSA